MKYSVDITINKPLKDVIAIFENPEDMKKWMKGLISFEQMDTEYGKPGSKTYMVFEMGRRKMKIVETIIANDLPKEFTASYNTKNVFNIVVNSFEELGPDSTKYITQQEFQFSGFMKIVSLMMAPAFKKQSIQYLQDFKYYVENK
jgi:hypothetical protein